MEFIARAKILYGPTEKIGFQVFVYFRFVMKPELAHQSLFKGWQKVNAWQKVVGKKSRSSVVKTYSYFRRKT